jgi:formylmethanofuran dehydrogenase subunit E
MPPCSWCENSVLCEHCDSSFEDDEVVYVDDEYLCHSCAKYDECWGCGNFFPEDDLNDDEDYVYCDSCIVPIRKKKVQNLISHKLYGH